MNSYIKKLLMPACFVGALINTPLYASAESITSEEDDEETQIVPYTGERADLLIPADVWQHLITVADLSQKDLLNLEETSRVFREILRDLPLSMKLKAIPNCVPSEQIVLKHRDFQEALKFISIRSLLTIICKNTVFDLHYRIISQGESSDAVSLEVKGGITFQNMRRLDRLLKKFGRIFSQEAAYRALAPLPDYEAEERVTVLMNDIIGHKGMSSLVDNINCAVETLIQLPASHMLMIVSDVDAFIPRFYTHSNHIQHNIRDCRVARNYQIMEPFMVYGPALARMNLVDLSRFKNLLKTYVFKSPIQLKLGRSKCEQTCSNDELNDLGIFIRDTVLELNEEYREYLLKIMAIDLKNEFVLDEYLSLTNDIMSLDLAVLQMLAENRYLILTSNNTPAKIRPFVEFYIGKTSEQMGNFVKQTKLLAGRPIELDGDMGVIEADDEGYSSDEYFRVPR